MDAANVEAAKPSMRAFSGARRWISTAAASLVTAYALDLFATSLGLLVVASGLLSGIGYVEALLVLLASYVFWGSGPVGCPQGELGPAAAHRRLHQHPRQGRPRPRRAPGLEPALAASGGLCRQRRDRAGEGGAVLYRRRRLRAVHAIRSARSMRSCSWPAPTPAPPSTALRSRAALAISWRAWRSAGVYASFDTEWEPSAYLKEYYSEIEPEERATIAFFVDAMKDADRTQPALVFGVGPTLHHVFLAAETVSEIHLGEYLPANLHEIEALAAARPRGARLAAVRALHAGMRRRSTDPRAEEITFREEMTRARITRLLHGRPAPRRIPSASRTTRQYATVISAYCADSATGDKAEWAAYMQRIAGLVRPGGMLLVAALAPLARLCGGRQDLSQRRTSTRPTCKRSWSRASAAAT